MANLYGVANSAGLVYAANTIGGADVVCNAGTNTAVVTSPVIVAPSQGFFFVLGLLSLTVTTGATSPGGLNIGIGIGAGSVGNVLGPSGLVLPASSTIYVSSYPWSASSQTAWQGLGSTVTVYVQAVGQAVTVRNSGTWVTFLLTRAPDQ